MIEITDYRRHFTQQWMRYPTLYKSFGQCMLSTFSGIGNGYEIEDGGLYYLEWPTNKDNLSEFDLSNFHTDDIAYASVHFSYCSSNFESLTDIRQFNFTRQDRLFGIDYHGRYYIQNVSKYCLLNQITADCDIELTRIAHEVGKYWLDVLQTTGGNADELIPMIDRIRGYLGLNTLAEFSQECVDLMKEIINER